MGQRGRLPAEPWGHQPQRDPTSRVAGDALSPAKLRRWTRGLCCPPRLCFPLQTALAALQADSCGERRPLHCGAGEGEVEKGLFFTFLLFLC